MLPFIPLLLASQDFARLTPPLPEAHILDVFAAAFAPGERIVHALGESVVVQPRAGGPGIPLLDGAREPWLLSAATDRLVAMARHPHIDGRVLVSRRLDGAGELFMIWFDEVEPDFALTPDGTRVVFREPAFDGRHSLLVGNIASFDLRQIVGARVVTGFRILPAGNALLFRGEPVPGGLHLWRVPLDFSPVPFLVSGPAVPGGNVEPEFELTPDGTRVVFRGDLAVDGRIELWSADTATGARMRLSATAVPAGAVRSFRLAPDGRRVVFTGDQRAAGVRELFVAPIDGSAPPVMLSPVLVGDGDVLDGFVIDPSSTFVAFRVRPDANHCALYTAPLDGSAPALRHWRAEGADGIAPDFRFDATGTLLAMRIDWHPGGRFDLLGADPRREQSLHSLSNVPDVLDFELGRGFAVVRARGDGEVPELWRAFTGSPTSTRLHPPLDAGHSVLPGYRIAPDQRSLVFTADPRVRGAFELFQVATRRPGRVRELTPAVARTTAPVDGLGAFELAGGRVVYQAAAEREDVVGLFSAPLDASGPPVALAPLLVAPGGIRTSLVVGERVVFVQGGDEVRNELHSAFVDGRAPAVRLDRPRHDRAEVLPRFRIDVASSSVVFVADSDFDEAFDLFRVPLDGSAAPTRLFTGSVVPRDVKSTFQLTRDGRWAVCAADVDLAGRFDLWTVALDGSGVAHPLARKAAGGGDVRAIALAPDDQTVVFLADLLVDDVFELFSVPLDASAAPRRLSGPLVSGGDVGEFTIEPRGQRVVYLAEQELDGESELYSVPLDASAPPVRLSPERQLGGFNHVWTVGRFLIAADGREVAFVSTRGQPGTYWLHSAPLDGSAPARWLDDRHRSWLTSWQLALTPDGSRAVYRIVTSPGAEKLRPGLFGVPLDGSRTPVVLNTPIAVNGFRLSADGAHVFYDGRDPDTGATSFFTVPVDGPRELSVELASESGAPPLAFEALEPGLVYSDGRALWSSR